MGMEEHGGGAEEARLAKERTSISVGVVYDAIRTEGEKELARSSRALAWSGLAAGLSMGFSLVLDGLLRHHLPETSWRPLVSTFGYTAGFLIVVLGRQQLFTENTLTVILPLLNRRDRTTLLNVLRLWSVVLIANIIGATLFAWVVANAGVFDAAQMQTLAAVGFDAFSGSFSHKLITGIFGGWLIALMVWLLPSAEMGRFWVIIYITYLVGLGGFAHVIAGSVEVLYLVMIGQIGWVDYLLDFLLPALTGNILGGTALVGLLSHAQVTSFPGEKRRNPLTGNE